jgi:NADH:ubiquinone oxidoreductase subunit K
MRRFGINHELCMFYILFVLDAHGSFQRASRLEIRFSIEVLRLYKALPVCVTR